MTASALTEARRALAMFPRGSFLLTASYDRKRAGQLVQSVQTCAEDPMLVCVCARRGHPIAPLIRDAHTFAVCRIDAEDRLLLRNFGPLPLPAKGDPFDALELDRLATGSPIPKRCIAVLDCQVIRHLDLEADHELYIGQVLAGRTYEQRL